MVSGPSAQRTLMFGGGTQECRTACDAVPRSQLTRGRCGGHPTAVSAQGTEDTTLVLMTLPTLISKFGCDDAVVPVHFFLEQYPLCCDRMFFLTVTHLCLKREPRENASQHLMQGSQPHFQDQLGGLITRVCCISTGWRVSVLSNRERINSRLYPGACFSNTQIEKA